MTLDDAVVLMPSFGDCPYRRENQEHVRAWYARLGVPVVLGHDQPAPAFSRARTVNAAARTAAREHPHRPVFLIADNDLIPSLSHLDLALRHLHEHAAATPHATTLLTTPAGRLEVLERGSTTQFVPEVKGSRSFVVIHRDAYARANGMDEAFIGWGPEDKAFLASIRKQLGSVLQLDGERLHLWHPPDPTKADAANLERNRARMRAYLGATTKAAARLAREYGRWDHAA